MTEERDNHGVEKSGDKHEKYLSHVRHELRGQLAIIHEAVSLVIDGVTKGSCDSCRNILKKALESSDRLKALIETMLSASSFDRASSDKKR